MSDTKELIAHLIAVGSSATTRAADTIARLEAANEAFGKRQAWWTERMFELEAKVSRLEAERDAARRCELQWRHSQLDGELVLWINGKEVGRVGELYAGQHSAVMLLVQAAIREATEKP